MGMDAASRHSISIAIAAMCLTVSAAGLIPLIIWAQSTPDPHLWANGWFRFVIGLLCLVAVIGFYALFSLWLPLPMPPPRVEPTRPNSRPASPALPPIQANRQAQDTALRSELPAPTPPVPAAPTPETAPAPEQKEITDVTPEYLLGFYEQFTSAQAQNLAQPFIGKWIQVSGPLHDVSDFNGGFCTVWFTLPEMIFINLRLVMTFQDKKWFERLRLMRRGRTITVLGQITKVSAAMVHLENCELVD